MNHKSVAHYRKIRHKIMIFLSVFGVMDPDTIYFVNVNFIYYNKKYSQTLSLPIRNQLLGYISHRTNTWFDIHEGNK
jgi:hypothetical protein